MNARIAIRKKMILATYLDLVAVTWSSFCLFLPCRPGIRVVTVKGSLSQTGFPNELTLLDPVNGLTPLRKDFELTINSGKFSSPACCALRTAIIMYPYYLTYAVDPHDADRWSKPIGCTKVCMSVRSADGMVVTILFATSMTGGSSSDSVVISLNPDGTEVYRLESTEGGITYTDDATPFLDSPPTCAPVPPPPSPPLLPGHPHVCIPTLCYSVCSMHWMHPHSVSHLVSCYLLHTWNFPCCSSAPREWAEVLQEGNVRLACVKRDAESLRHC